MKQPDNWLITTIFAEDALESRNARDYFSDATHFVISLPPTHPVSNGSNLEYLLNCYADLTQAADSLNDILQHYEKNIPADYVPVIPDAKYADSEPMKKFKEDFGVVYKCNRHFGRNRNVLTKVAKDTTDADELAEILQRYEDFIAATRPLAKYLGEWLDLDIKLGA